MVLSTLLGRRKLEIGQRDISRFIKQIDELNRDADGLVIAANYRGGVPYLEIIGHRLHIPYVSSELVITREPPNVVKPSWAEYCRLAQQFQHPYHLMLDDHISPEAFGSLLYQHWLQLHGIPADRIKTAGIVDDSGTADIYVVRGVFLSSVNRKGRKELLEDEIKGGKIPAQLSEPEANDLTYLLEGSGGHSPFGLPKTDELFNQVLK